MPLIDHFHPPLSDERHWESFHATWAIEIMATLNRGVLPAGYFAEAQVHVGSRVEIDVGTFERNGGSSVAPAFTYQATGNVGPGSSSDSILVTVASIMTGVTGTYSKSVPMTIATTAAIPASAVPICPTLAHTRSDIATSIP